MPHLQKKSISKKHNSIVSYVYVDPITFKESTEVYKGKKIEEIAEKVYKKMINGYNQNDNLIIPPTLILYLKNIENPKKIYCFEANVASFDMKPYMINIDIGGKKESLNVNRSIPHIKEISVSSKVKKSIINGKQFASNNSSQKNNNLLPKAFIPNQTYDISSLINIFVPIKYILFISECIVSDENDLNDVPSVTPPIILFRIIDRYEYIIDLVSSYIKTSNYTSSNTEINVTVDNAHDHISFSFVSRDSHRNNILVEIKAPLLPESDFKKILSCVKKLDGVDIKLN